MLAAPLLRGRRGKRRKLTAGRSFDSADGVGRSLAPLDVRMRVGDGALRVVPGGEERGAGGGGLGGLGEPSAGGAGERGGEEGEGDRGDAHGNDVCWWV